MCDTIIWYHKLQQLLTICNHIKSDHLNPQMCILFMNRKIQSKYTMTSKFLLSKNHKNNFNFKR